MEDLSLAVRFAWREMRAGLRGFAIFFSCIMLGVAAIAGVRGISTLISDEFGAQGRTLLGGDLRITLTQGTASHEEMAFFGAHGRVASSIWMRTMARRTEMQEISSAKGASQQVVELKAVDEAYPLYGSFITEPSGDFQSLFASRDGKAGVVVASALLQRLGLQIGDSVEIGTKIFEIRAVVKTEPDLLSEGLQLGLRVFMSQEALATTGLLQQGSLYAHIYKIAFFSPNRGGNNVIEIFREQLEENFPQTRWNLRSFAQAAPALETNISRFLQFLTLVGLTALVVGGLGVAQAVKVHLDRKREVIAIFKTLGASGNFIFMVYLTQILIISLMAIAAGMVVAALMPVLFLPVLQQFLPVIWGWVFYPAALAVGAVFALLCVFAFALSPLGLARATRVTSLLRPSVTKGEWVRTPVSYRLISGFLLLLVAILAVFLGSDRRLAVIFIAAIIGVFLILKFLDLLIEVLARRFTHSRFLVLRLALGNIHRPGSLTSAVVRALGLGLTLLVALTTLDGNLHRQLSTDALEEVPTFFFMDIAGARGEEFRSFMQVRAPEARLRMMATLRARITALKGVAAEQAKIDEDGRWVLRGDRNVGISALPPEGTRLVKGSWWEEDYEGISLVSFSRREAERLNLDVGDTISLNVLGRAIEAQIANLRDVDWDSLKMNFVMIFSPNTFVGAPYGYLATLDMAADELQEAVLTRQLGQDFPNVTVLSTRTILDDARQIADQIGLGVRASAAIVLLASILVLAGALSAGNRSRARTAVVLKILGARRRTLIAAFVLEYVILGIFTAFFAFVVGSVAGVGVARWRMNLSQATLVPEAASLVLVVGIVLSVGLGLIGIWRILGHKPARALREL